MKTLFISLLCYGFTVTVPTNFNANTSDTQGDSLIDIQTERWMATGFIDGNCEEHAHVIVQSTQENTSPRYYVIDLH